MRKTTVIPALLTAAVLMLTACGRSDGYKDGSYRAEGSTADDHGWKEYLAVTVKDGEIVSADFDYTNTGGMKKTNDEAYKNQMIAAGCETWPADFCQKLEDSYLAEQEADDVDTVAGATASSEAFRKLAAALERSMVKGKKDIVVVDTAG